MEPDFAGRVTTFSSQSTTVYLCQIPAPRDINPHVVRKFLCALKHCLGICGKHYSFASRCSVHDGVCNGHYPGFADTGTEPGGQVSRWTMFAGHFLI